MSNQPFDDDDIASIVREKGEQFLPMLKDCEIFMRIRPVAETVWVPMPAHSVSYNQGGAPTRVHIDEAAFRASVVTVVADIEFRMKSEVVCTTTLTTPFNINMTGWV